MIGVEISEQKNIILFSAFFLVSRICIIITPFPKHQAVFTRNAAIAEVKETPVIVTGGPPPTHHPSGTQRWAS